MIEEQKSRRPLGLGWRTFAIAASAAGIGIAMLVALHDPAPPTSRFTVTASEDDTPATTAPDPLMTELLRCRSLPAGSDDAACREAWEVNRRRFMGESRSYVPPTSAAAAGGR